MFSCSSVACALGFFSKKFSSTAMSWNVSLTFSSSSVVVSGFKVGTLIHNELMLCVCQGGISYFLLCLVLSTPSVDFCSFFILLVNADHHLLPK